jgi:hypothetical protein
MWNDVSQELIASIFRGLATCYTLVSCSADFRRWRRSWYVPTKRRFTYGLHGAISQKMATFISTGVRTTDPANKVPNYCMLYCVVPITSLCWRYFSYMYPFHCFPHIPQNCSLECFNVFLNIQTHISVILVLLVLTVFLSFSQFGTSWCRTFCLRRRLM